MKDLSIELPNSALEVNRFARRVAVCKERTTALSCLIIVLVFSLALSLDL